MEDFEVMWPHIGDRPYQRGDIRRAVPAQVKHLIANGTLKRKAEAKPVKKSEPKSRNKAESAPLNKVEAAPANKAGTATESKAGEPDPEPSTGSVTLKGKTSRAARAIGIGRKG